MKTKAQLETENRALRNIARDLHWMARRYADGRSSYAPSLFNDHTRALIAMGVELNKCDSTLFARDGGGRAYDNLTPEEAGECN